MTGEVVVLAVWQYALLLFLSFLIGVAGGALGLFVWQTVTLNRQVNRLLQDLPQDLPGS
ncbi:hypothetical protein [Deinococcus soli (ex Cha et al. 2016)]|uniref:Flp pilus assembly protein TadB n=1 Tax=Deinococcus soli (ex Cha et al. 2016) TaxID=1309411 RepID=A0ACC6KNP4_9DEIO|nr:hypothetical protein [Deinococcus soli (ex Cha et al. 2016)]MDR6330676.1 Flp pilus assembly protein TadB [Deinococcus soli (ex Cha et al. 2016)]MDR6754043.1 Flp pilus assembly protein TadB [Deinococcus soli (ex Cha et al. 2016)]